ncbi:serine protease, partial [Mortierella alpina]
NIHSRVAERNRLQLAQQEQRGEQKLEQEPVPNQVDHEYDFGTWKGYAGQFSSEFVKELETHDDVEYVEEDTLMWAWGIDPDSGVALDTQGESTPLDADQEASTPAASLSKDTSDFDTSAVVNGHSINLEYFSLKAPSWGLARISERERDLAKDYSYMSSAGADVDVYIIDSGVYAEHSDFGGRAFNLANFVYSEKDTDTCGHGTHVAGIVAGRRYGVAKAARIQAIKVLDAEGQGSTSQVMAGINFMIKHAAKNPNPKKVINMSLGGQSSRPVNDAVRVAVTQYGLPFFVAAGNTGDDACQYSPAGVKEAFAVGGSDRSDRVGWYSCTGQCVNLFAPGSGITSDWIRSPSSAHILDGTSMAAPHVAGVAALFLGAGNTYSSAQGLYDDLVRLSTKGIISGLMMSDARTTRNLLYNKLEDISAAISIQPQDDLVANEEQATEAKVNARKKTKKMRDESDRSAGRHHHHHHH